MSFLQSMGESGMGGASANWNMLGTTSKRDKELWEEKRRQWEEARTRGEDPFAESREKYEKWCREERVPTWQERLLDRITGKEKNKKRAKGEGDGEGEEGKRGRRRGFGARGREGRGSREAKQSKS